MGSIPFYLGARVLLSPPFLGRSFSEDLGGAEYVASRREIAIKNGLLPLLQKNDAESPRLLSGG